ncbi:hypothetical protein D3C78_1172630 [compost metagenome]
MLDPLRLAAQLGPAMVDSPQVVYCGGKAVLSAGNPWKLKAEAADFVERPLIEPWRWRIWCLPQLRRQCMKIVSPKLQDAFGCLRIT